MPTPSSTHLILVILRWPADSRRREELRQGLSHFKATALAQSVYLINEGLGVDAELHGFVQRIARSGGEALLGRGELMNGSSPRCRSNAHGRSA